jgi:hypothetical protein
MSNVDIKNFVEEQKIGEDEVLEDGQMIEEEQKFWEEKKINEEQKLEVKKQCTIFYNNCKSKSVGDEDVGDYKVYKRRNI